VNNLVSKDQLWSDFGGLVPYDTEKWKILLQDYIEIREKEKNGGTESKATTKAGSAPSSFATTKTPSKSDDI
jgi:hypothetical protein